MLRTHLTRLALLSSLAISSGCVGLGDRPLLGGWFQRCRPGGTSSDCGCCPSYGTAGFGGYPSGCGYPSGYGYDGPVLQDFGPTIQGPGPGIPSMPFQGGGLSPYQCPGLLPQDGIPPPGSPDKLQPIPTNPNSPTVPYAPGIGFIR